MKTNNPLPSMLTPPNQVFSPGDLKSPQANAPTEPRSIDAQAEYKKLMADYDTCEAEGQGTHPAVMRG